VHYLQEINHRAVKRIDQTLEHIFHLLPESRSGRGGLSLRQSRGLFDFVGELSSSLFGTAKNSDVEKMQKAVEHLHQQQQHLVETWTKSSDRMASFGKAVNHRIDGVKQMILSQRQETDKLFRAVYGEISDITRISEWIAITLRRFEDFVFVLDHLNTIKNDLEMLAHGMLSSTLITPDQIERTVHQVERELTQLEGVNLQLLRPRVRDFYLLHNFMHLRRGRNVYIHVQLPVGLFSEYLTLYRVYTRSIPTPGSPGHVTKLVNVPIFLAYNPTFSRSLRKNRTLEGISFFS